MAGAHTALDPCSSAAGPPSPLPLPASPQGPSPGPSLSKARTLPAPGPARLGHAGRGSWGLKAPAPEKDARELLQELLRTPLGQRATS